MCSGKCCYVCKLLYVIPQKGFLAKSLHGVTWHGMLKNMAQCTVVVTADRDVGGSTVLEGSRSYAAGSLQ